MRIYSTKWLADGFTVVSSVRVLRRVLQVAGARNFIMPMVEKTYKFKFRNYSAVS